MERPRRVALINMAYPISTLEQQHTVLSRLPTFKRLISGGAIANIRPVPRAATTQSFWSAITTASWHTELREQGLSPISEESLVEGGAVRPLERLWDALAKFGRKSLLLDSGALHWSTAEFAKTSEGERASPDLGQSAEMRIGIPRIVCSDQIIQGMAASGTCHPGSCSPSDHAGKPLSLDLPATPIEIQFPNAREQPVRTIWHLAISPSGADHAQRLSLIIDNRQGEPLCTLSVGQWSPRLTAPIEMRDGSLCNVFFRCKLLELSEDASRFRLYLTPMIDCGTDSSSFGTRQFPSDSIPIPCAAISSETSQLLTPYGFAELQEMHDEWVGDVAGRALCENDWDAFIMDSFGPTLSQWLPDYWGGYDTDGSRGQVEERSAKALSLIQHSQERLLGRLLSCMGRDTLLVIVVHSLFPAHSPGIRLPEACTPLLTDDEAPISHLDIESPDGTNLMAREPAGVRQDRRAQVGHWRQEDCPGSMSVIFCGPGIKKGLALHRSAQLIDIAPTFCYLLNLPLPEHTEGAVLYQLFRDVNFRLSDPQPPTGNPEFEGTRKRRSRGTWGSQECL